MLIARNKRRTWQHCEKLRLDGKNVKLTTLQRFKIANQNFALTYTVIYVLSLELQHDFWRISLVVRFEGDFNCRCDECRCQKDGPLSGKLYHSLFIEEGRKTLCNNCSIVSREIIKGHKDLRVISRFAYFIATLGVCNAKKKHMTHTLH